MIIDFFISVLAGLVNAILFIIPNFQGLDLNTNTSFNTFLGVLGKANTLFPIDTLFSILTLVFTIETGILIWRFSEWAASKIWPTGQMKLL